MKKIILILGLLTMTASVFAQTDIQLSQQINNRIIFNPAATGQSGCYNFTLLAREQWTGIDGAPSTQLFNFNKYFKSPKLGIGATIVYDRVGVEKTLNAKALIAYHVWLTDEMTLSFGLGLGIMNKTVEGSKLIYEDPNDPNAIVTKESKLSPDFDFGMEYNFKRLSIGASSTHLISSFKRIENNFKVPRHWYAYAKYSIKCSDAVDLIPALSWNNLDNVNLMEINAMTNVKDRVSVGLSYRFGLYPYKVADGSNLHSFSSDALVLIAGVKIIDALRLSYSYDFKIGNIKYGKTKGSHEIMLLCRFGCDKTANTHPRFFN